MPRARRPRGRRKKKRGRRPPPEPAVPEGLPVVAIVGRPNVGKSTLFNAWSGRRRAIVSRTPGTTRDRLSALATAERTSGEEVRFELVDTGGLFERPETPLDQQIADQVHLALEVAVKLRDGGRKVRVVSIPCLELFGQQTIKYRKEVLPPSLTKRVVIEAGIRLGWGDILGRKGIFVGRDDFGASAPQDVLAKTYGFTAEAVMEKIAKAKF